MPLAALAASGLPTDAFLYLGYLPRKAVERRKLIGQIANLPYTLIFLEAPHRLLEALVDLQEGLGDRPISLGRELTKLHEEIWRGRLSAARVHFTEEPPRGEFTLVIGGKEAALGVAWTEDELHAAIREGLKSGEAASALAAQMDVLLDASVEREADPHNLVRIILGKRQTTDSEAENVYTRAAASFRDWHCQPSRQ